MIRTVALLLTVLTGFSALVYEVAWQKALATLLGSQSEATAAVLGLFLGGLALGYAIFGRFTERRLAAAGRRPPRLLFAYGVLEIGIGLWALAFPLLFRGVRLLSFAIPHGGGGLGFVLDVVLSALIVLPPTVLMGATIPLLTQALARGLDDATRVHAWVYGFNTAGAVAGALAAGFWLVPAWGLYGTLVATASVNLVAGAVFLVLGRRSVSRFGPPSGGASAAVAVPGFASFAAAALLLGFAMMAVQTTFNRLGALSLGSSQFTFSMVVAVFVLCIAVGSLLVSALPRVPDWLLAVDLWALAGTLLLLYPNLPDAPYWAHALRSMLRDDPAGFGLYHSLAFLGILFVIGLPVTLCGAALPLIFDRLRSRVGELGNLAGRLYSLNTLGSLVGALLGGYLLLFWLDLDQIYRISVGALVVAAGLVSRESLRGNSRRLALGLAVPFLALLWLLPDWDTQRLSSGLYRQRAPTAETFHGPDAFFEAWNRQREVRFYRDDPVVSVAVIGSGGSGSDAQRGIYLNGKPDSSLPADFPTTTLLGLLPALMSEHVERAFVVGFGTGSTVGALAGLRSMREIVVTELSPAVIEAAPYFEGMNGGPLAFPGTRFVQRDAFRELMRSDARYDVIVSAPSNPWVAGVEMLYSREFLEAAQKRLAPGGVLAQWFQFYEMDDATVNMVLRTYAAVFEHMSVWVTQGADLILLGFTDPGSALDLERIERRFRRVDFAEGFARARIRTFPQLLGHELLPLGTLAALSLQGRLHTLMHPRLSDAAARAFFVGQWGSLPSAAPRRVAQVAVRNSLLQRYLSRSGDPLSDVQQLSIAASTCVGRAPGCAAHLANWRHAIADSPTRERLESKLPQMAPDFDLRVVEELEALFGGPSDGPVRPQDATRATRLFAEHYHPGVPFPREVLDAIWERCQGPAGAGCPRARARVSAELGDLDR